MTRSSAAAVAPTSLPAWRMPIVLESYPDRDPLLTDEEAALIAYYTAESNGVIGGRARVTLEKLRRLDKPFLDTLRLHTKSVNVIAASRRHLFTYMVQTRRAFWSWSKETWFEVIQAVPGGPQFEGTKFCMMTLAYLFSGVLCVGPRAPYVRMAEIIFGKKRVDEEVDKLHAPLIALGYSQHAKEKRAFAGCIRWQC